MEVKRCISCMMEINEDVCPYCGCDSKSVPKNPMGLKPETLLHGRYLVGKILGQGGFGITYVGFDLVLNIKVAIKEYFPSGNASRDHSVSNTLQWSPTQLEGDAWKEGCEHFLKEARRMAKIDSIPEIVRVRDTFFENQTAYIIMDFVEGVTLKSYLLQNGPMGFSTCVQMLIPLLKGLEAVHKQNMIHRDISPDNIIIQPDGSLKLLDFGAAKDIETMRDGLSQMVTKKGFSPPEQYMESGNIGTWTDVYAMSATIYYCITGRVTPDAMDRMMDDPLTFQLPLVEPISEYAESVLRQGMALKTADRIQTVDMLLQCLLTAIGQSMADMNVYGNQTAMMASGYTDTLTQNYNAGNLVTAETKASKKKNKRKKTSKIKWIVLASVLALALIGGGITLLVLKPWYVYIEVLGNSNSNVLNDGGFVLIENKFEYYLDHNNILYECTYDAQDLCFYVDEGVELADNVWYLCAGEDTVYYVKENGNTKRDICASTCGSGKEDVLYSGTNAVCFLQYALLSNDEEYLYFMDYGSEDQYYVYRYNLESGKKETVVADDVYWFNIYKDSVYYTAMRDGEMNLVKTNLKGEKEKILKEGEVFAYGFVEEDSIYLYSLDKETVVILDLEGKETGGLYDVRMDPTFFTFAYGDDWIYYVSADDFAVHKVRTNGSGDEVFLEGLYAVSMCYAEGSLWLAEGMVVDDGIEMTRAYIMNVYGGDLFALTDADVRTTENGVQYKLSGGEAVICGYVGDKEIVGIPLVIDGYNVTDIEENSLPEGHTYLLIEEEDSFDYDVDETGTGVIIYGYHGTLSGFMIPDTIEGLPVVAIAPDAFKDSTDLEKIAFPAELTSVGDQAFMNCENLSFVGVNDNLAYIGASAFLSCTSLSSFTLPDSLLSVGNYAFAYAGVTEINIPGKVESIGVGAFASCQILTVDSYNMNYLAEDNVLLSKNKQVLISAPWSLSGEYTVPGGVTNIADYAFAGCSGITGVTLPPTVLEVGSMSFNGCTGLTHVEMTENVKSIGENAFQGCTALPGITVSPDCAVAESVGVSVSYFEED